MIQENEHEENIHSYIRQITLAQEEERKRVARDLHDDISPRILLFINKLEALEEQCRSKNTHVREGFSELRDLAEDALESLRRTAQGLRPRIIDDLGLAAAIEWLAEEMERDESLTVTVKSTGMDREPPPEVSIVLFRITQEALTNIRKHAGARNVSIVLSGSDDDISVEISDNGRGFIIPDRIDENAREGHLGLMGMDERARLVNGTLRILSAPGKGTTIIARLPRDAGR